jgi:hypothetical protein
MDFVLDDIGLDAPMIDFLSRNISEQLLSDAQAVRYLGTSLFRGSVFDHVVIRGPDADVQLWIPAEGRPLPGKLAITSKWEAGSPRFVVFLEWDTSPDFPKGALVFAPPKGATRIEFDLGR